MPDKNLAGRKLQRIQSQMCLRGAILPMRRNSGPKKLWHRLWKRLLSGQSARPRVRTLTRAVTALLDEFRMFPSAAFYTQSDLPKDWNYDQYLDTIGQPPFT